MQRGRRAACFCPPRLGTGAHAASRSGSGGWTEVVWRHTCPAAADSQLPLAPSQSGNSSQLLFLGDSITEVWRGTFCGVPCNPVLELHCDQ